MKHLGDITKIHNAPFVDCITFGSPCQDLSIAGRRAGLAGERSGLFMEAVRIIKEMREQSGGVYPTFAIWENVPGAFSSNRGEDFRAVLEELARVKETGVSIPRPAADKKGRIKWAKAGFICGDGWSLAWRTFDAQFWGVPQRRKRIALVVDFGGQRAGEILFERTGVSGHSEPIIPPWKGIARNPAHSAAGHDRVVEGQTAGGNQVTACLYAAYGTKWNGNGGAYSGDNFVMEPEKECLTSWDVQSRRIYEENGKWPALYAGEGGGHGYVMLENPLAYTLKIRSGCEGGGKGPLVQTEKSATLSTLQDQTLFVAAYPDTARTLTERHDGSPCADRGPNIVCCAAFTAGQGAKANGIGWAEEQAPTLRTNGGLSAMPTVLCRAHGQANAETLEDCAPTLNCNHEQPIVFESHSQDARYTQQGDTSPACTAQWGTDGNNMPLVAFSKEAYNSGENASCSLGVTTDETAPTIRADTHPSGVAYLARCVLRWIVRRLTPTECERLQGFPDGWTDIGAWVDSKGKRHKPSDSPRYKALGNSIALPQWWWLTCKMAQYLPEHATLGSLFDGIGGFPLVWETLHGKGTAVWASEIEEFPIAVTKRRFEE